MWGVPWSDLPLIAWYVLTLVILEGLLSADNALVLAVMVRHLPARQQKQALRYGLWGAFGFRLIAVLLSAVLMRFWIFKVVGGLYLVYLALAHFLGAHDPSPDEAGRQTAREARGLEEELLGDGRLGRAGRRRVLDRLDPGRRGHGREPAGSLRRQLEAGHRLPRRRARHHHDAVRGRVLHRPARPVRRAGHGGLPAGGLDRPEARGRGAAHRRPDRRRDPRLAVLVGDARDRRDRARAARRRARRRRCRARADVDPSSDGQAGEPDERPSNSILDGHKSLELEEANSRFSRPLAPARRRGASG